MAYNHCCYGVSATNEEYKNLSLSHKILWEAILYAKKRDVKNFEVGRDYARYDVHSRSDTGEQLEEKQRQIAHFKSGFGGKLYVNANVKTT